MKPSWSRSGSARRETDIPERNKQQKLRGFILAFPCFLLQNNISITMFSDCYIIKSLLEASFPSHI